MVPGERYVAYLLFAAVLGMAVLYVQVPSAAQGDLAAVSLDDEGDIATFEGTVLDVAMLEQGVAFRLVGGGSVRAVSWEPVDVEEGDRVRVTARVDEYRDEPELVVRKLEVLEHFRDRDAVGPDAWRGGDAVSLERAVDLGVDGGVVLDGGVFVEGADASPGEVLRVDGVLVDPGLPKVVPVRTEVTGLDRDRVHRSVSAMKRAVYDGEQGSVEVTGVVGGRRFDWLLYLYDDSTRGVEERHVNDVLVNEVPLRFPRDYVGEVPEDLDRVRVMGELDSYRGNPQVLVRSVEVLGRAESEPVSGEVVAVDGREVQVDGEVFVASPGSDLEEGDAVDGRWLTGVRHSGEGVRVLVD